MTAPKTWNPPDQKDSPEAQAQPEEPGMTTPSSVPQDYVPSRWVSVFSKRELQYLCEAQDQRAKELRIVNRRLTAQLTAADRTHEPPLPSTTAERE